MQKEKINRPFFKNWKSIKYELRIKKIRESQNKVIGRLFLFRLNRRNEFLSRKTIAYVFSGFSIIFIGYVLMNILTTYPPREIGISP
ncbi:MAG: hypothetical protein MUO21_00745 [Nitrososphaeraceae archaeon]|nr:hypothetical protein [Nitrososphaeraceae archaeon]